jgi:hypothetical protein
MNVYPSIPLAVKYESYQENITSFLIIISPLITLTAGWSSGLQTTKLEVSGTNPDSEWGFL